METSLFLQSCNLQLQLQYFPEFQAHIVELETWGWHLRLLGLSHEDLSWICPKAWTRQLLSSFSWLPCFFYWVDLSSVIQVWRSSHLWLLSFPSLWLVEKSHWFGSYSTSPWSTTFFLLCHCPRAAPSPQLDWLSASITMLQTVNGALFYIRWGQMSRSHDVPRLGLGSSHKFPTLLPCAVTAIQIEWLYFSCFSLHLCHFLQPFPSSSSLSLFVQILPIL